MSDFISLGLPTLITDSLTAGGFTEPTKIQTQAIPKLLEGRDMLGIAQTGSGKTAAFGLPILAGILTLTGRPRPMTTRALILAPTRELALQVADSMSEYGKHLGVRVLAVYGGQPYGPQIGGLKRGESKPVPPWPESGKALVKPACSTPGSAPTSASVRSM